MQRRRISRGINHIKMATIILCQFLSDFTGKGEVKDNNDNDAEDKKGDWDNTKKEDKDEEMRRGLVWRR